MDAEIIEVGIGRMHDFGWRRAVGDGTMRFLDSEIADTVSNGAESVFLLTAPIDDGTYGGAYGCELNVVIADNGGEMWNVETSEGLTAEEAEMSCCFWAAAQGIFDRLDEREMNCEDATNRLAYEAAALWANEPMTGEFSDHLLEGIGYFLGLAREYVKDCGPSEGIEWVEF